MDSTERRERSRELRARLTAAPLKDIPANHLGKAAYAYLIETTAAEPYDSSSGAAQTFNIIRKGANVGDLNIARTTVFLDALGKDPVAEIDHWAERNGSHPEHPRPKQEPRKPEEPLLVEPIGDESLTEVLDTMERLYHRAKAEEQAKKAEWEQARQAAQGLLAALKATGRVPREPRRKREEREGGRHTARVSDENVARLEAAIRDFVSKNPPILPEVPNSFIRPQLKANVQGMGDSTINYGTEILRGRGVLRLVGNYRPEGYTKGTPAKVYALV